MAEGSEGSEEENILEPDFNFLYPPEVGRAEDVELSR